MPPKKDKKKIKKIDKTASPDVDKTMDGIGDMKLHDVEVQQEEQKKVNMAQTSLNTEYQSIKASYDKYKTDNNHTGILLTSISLFVGQFANVVIKEKNLMSAQIEIINKFFDLIEKHLNKLKTTPAKEITT